MIGKKIYYERNLPHWQPEGRQLFVTWRLSGSLPAKVMSRLRASKTSELGRRFREFDVELDRGVSGPLWMQETRVAEIVVDGIKGAEQKGMCKVHAWVVMPNHVHLLVEPLATVARITQAIKGRTARNANATLGRIGKMFWQDESFDRWIRNEGEFGKVKDYIERNPVLAGLVERERDWAWSSAGVGNASVDVQNLGSVGEKFTG
jgi:putative DNA methylase